MLHEKWMTKNRMYVQGGGGGGGRIIFWEKAPAAAAATAPRDKSHTFSIERYCMNTEERGGPKPL